MDDLLARFSLREGEQRRRPLARSADNQVDLPVAGLEPIFDLGRPILDAMPRFDGALALAVQGFAALPPIALLPERLVGHAGN